MLTWLDYYCRKALHDVDEKWHGGDPRRALATSVATVIARGKRGILPPGGILEESFYALLASLIAEFIPAPGNMTFADGTKPERPLGLILTRETANLLSAASPLDMTDELWRAEVGTKRAIYVDVPHGALLLDAAPDQGDIIQIRAIFAAPFLPNDAPGHTLFIAQITDRGSETERGQIGGVLLPDGKIARFGSTNTGATAASWLLKPPFAHSKLEMAVLGRAGTFLRLVLAYYLFGPKDAQEPIASTPTERLNLGKPRKNESLFALSRLHSPNKLGRPASTIPSSWSLMSRQEVTGHFKLQAHGPKQSLRRLIWVASYERGPQDAPMRPQGYRI